MPQEPGSLESLRRVNRSRALAVLQRRGGASRADIVRETGLSRTTVSSLVADLLTEGLVVERPDSIRQPASPNGGRPATLLTLDPASGGFAGIDFGHDSVRVAIVDRSGALQLDSRESLDVDHHANRALSKAASMVRSLLRNAGIPRQRLIGVGVAVSAPLRSAHVAIASERIFPSWVELDVGEALRSRLRRPVYVSNDANLGALAEATFGAARGVKNVLYVMLSAGVGAGLILDGTLYQGDGGTAGELGHVVVDPGGQICRCGNRGCLETVAGTTALTEALRYTHGSEFTLQDLLHLAEARDPGALRVIGDAGRAVGKALAGMCSMLDPGMVVIGGELAASGDVLLDSIRDAINRSASAVTGHPYTVVGGALGASAEALGAAALAMERASRGIIDQPLVAQSPAVDQHNRVHQRTKENR